MVKIAGSTVILIFLFSFSRNLDVGEGVRNVLVRNVCILMVMCTKVELRAKRESKLADF